MALTTGFDPQVVTTSINNVKNAYSRFMDTMHDSMQRDFIDDMQDKWACKDAQETFANLKTLLEELLRNANVQLGSVVRSMDSAARTWAESTNAEYTSQTFEERPYTINVTGIQENIGGIRGIDLESASSTASKLPNIAQEATSALNDAKSAVSECGFMGGDQQNQLNSSLETIKNNIDSFQNEITTAMKTRMDNTVASYGDLAGKVSSAFAGTGE